MLRKYLTYGYLHIQRRTFLKSNLITSKTFKNNGIEYYIYYSFYASSVIDLSCSRNVMKCLTRQLKNEYDKKEKREHYARSTKQNCRGNAVTLWIDICNDGNFTKYACDAIHTPVYFMITDFSPLPYIPTLLIMIVIAMQR